MQFDTFTFLLFFSVVIFLYFTLTIWSQRKLVLLVASYIFYSAWNPLFLLLILFSTIVDWYLAKFIGAAQQDKQRRFYLILSLVANLGLLAYFKYGGFFLDVFVDICQLFSIEYHPPDWNIILPVGISFYTFQTMSYTIDVYRGHLEPSKRFADYALYVGFFPQLVAGPIVRASFFLPQCIKPKPFDIDQFGYGILLIATGLFAKIILSDTYLLPIVDFVYSNSKTVGSFEAWIAVFAFSGQIFFDFSGYSLCAIGSALCFGFVLPSNFDSPYGAVGFSDFWRRWHISLSQWLRDYLYISLGGSHQSKIKILFSLFITMFLGGLWHGAAWGFVAWGMLHGSYLIIEHLLKDYVPGTIRNNNIFQLIMALITFNIVSLTWVLFRAPDFNVALTIFDKLIHAQNPEINILEVANGAIYVFIITGLLFLYHMVRRTNSFATLAKSLPWWVKGPYLAILLLCITFLSSGEKNAFIYFQF